MQNQQKSQLQKALSELENTLKKAHLWETLPPDHDRLLSTAPFMIDTLDFNQWLQWVLIPKINFIIDNDTEISGQSDMSSMAEVWLKQNQRKMPELIKVIKKIDLILSKK